MITFEVVTKDKPDLYFGTRNYATLREAIQDYNNRAAVGYPDRTQSIQISVRYSDDTRTVLFSKGDFTYVNNNLEHVLRKIWSE